MRSAIANKNCIKVVRYKCLQNRNCENESQNSANLENAQDRFTKVPFVVQQVASNHGNSKGRSRVKEKLLDRLFSIHSVCKKRTCKNPFYKGEKHAYRVHT